MPPLSGSLSSRARTSPKWRRLKMPVTGSSRESRSASASGPLEVAVRLLHDLQGRGQLLRALGREVQRGVSPAGQGAKHERDGEGQRAADQQDQPGQKHFARGQGSAGHAHGPGAARSRNGRLDGVVEAGSDRGERCHLVAELERGRVGCHRQRLGDQLLGIDQPRRSRSAIRGGDLAAVAVGHHRHAHVEALVAVRQLDGLGDGDLLVERRELRVGQRRPAGSPRRRTRVP